MEPRWRDFNQSNTFIGSFDRFDLWLAAHPIRPERPDVYPWIYVTWGPAYSEYDRYRVNDTHLELQGFYHEKSGPTEQDMLQIEHYLYLFAPALGLVSRLSEGSNADGT